MRSLLITLLYWIASKFVKKDETDKGTLIIVEAFYLLGCLMGFTIAILVGLISYYAYVIFN